MVWCAECIVPVAAIIVPVLLSGAYDTGTIDATGSTIVYFGG